MLPNKTYFPLLILFIAPFHIFLIEEKLPEIVYTNIGGYLGFSLFLPALYFKIKDSDDPNKSIKLKTFRRMILGILLVFNITILLLEKDYLNIDKLNGICYLLIFIIISNANMILKSFNDEKISVYLEDEEVFQKTNRLISKMTVIGGILGIWLIIFLPIEKWYIFIYMTYFLSIQTYGYFYAKKIYFEKYKY